MYYISILIVEFIISCWRSKTQSKAENSTGKKQNKNKNKIYIYQCVTKSYPGTKSYPFYENIKLIYNPEFSIATYSIDPIQIHNITNKIGLLA